MLLLEILMFLIVGLVAWWSWRAGSVSGRRNLSGLVLGLLVVGVFVYPWIVGADWGLVFQTLLALGAVGLVALVYGRWIARLRARAADRDR